MENSAQAATQAGPAAHDTLKAVRQDFPHFKVWREITGERTLHFGEVSQDALRGVPVGREMIFTAEHVVIHPGDVRVLHLEAHARAFPWRAAGLGQGCAQLPEIISDDGVRAAAWVHAPGDIPQVARANRQFVTRAVRHVAGEGIRQFIDVGAGLPTAPAVHQTAQEVNPGARVAYVDNDPLVLAYARALLAKGPGVTVIPGDLRDPAPILANPDLRLLLDPDQPVCILLASVLHFLLPAEADATVATFRAAMAPGSYLIVSAGTSTGTSRALIDRLRSAYADTSDITGRPAEEIAAWLTGLDVIPPGLVDVDAWRPGSPRHWLTRPDARIIGAVARKPARTAGAKPALPRRRPASHAS